LSSLASPYRVSAGRADAPLRQGEILSNLTQVRLLLSSLGSGQLQIEEIRHPFAITLTQDCDLEQDFSARHGSVAPDKQIPSVLFCMIATAEELFGKIKNSQLWNRIKRNNGERYHFLESVNPACDTLQEGLPELGIDFKQYFTLPTEEVYARIEMEQFQRRTLLVSPYMEQFCNRFANYLSRVGLPLPHVST
jgi:hypothetical protein